MSKNKVERLAFWIGLAAVAFAAAVTAPVIANGGDPFTGPDIVETLKPAAQPTPECECEDCKCDPCVCGQAAAAGRPRIWDPGQSMQIDAMLERITALERNQVSRAEVRQIAEVVAEEVYQRYASKLNIQVGTPGGKTRTETVVFDDPARSVGFDLAPGERLLSYTDTATGRTVSCGPAASISVPVYPAPILSYQTPLAEMRIVEEPTIQARRVFVRPVVEEYRGNRFYRRGVIGGRALGSCANGQCN